MDDNFDAKEWINAAFKNQKEAGTSKDVSCYLAVRRYTVY